MLAKKDNRFKNSLSKDELNFIEHFISSTKTSEIIWRRLICFLLKELEIGRYSVQYSDVDPSRNINQLSILNSC